MIDAVGDSRSARTFRRRRRIRKRAICSRSRARKTIRCSKFHRTSADASASSPRSVRCRLPCLGFDVEALMEGARRRRAAGTQDLLRESGAGCGFHSVRSRTRTQQNEFSFCFRTRRRSGNSAFWFKQLWGESLGKKLDRRGREVYYGQTPTAALGVTDQHSQLQLFIEGPNDKSFLFWDVKEFRQSSADRASVFAVSIRWAT